MNIGFAFNLEDPMAEVIIKANVNEGDVIMVGYNKKKDVLTIKVEKTKHEETA